MRQRLRSHVRALRSRTLSTKASIVVAGVLAASLAGTVVYAATVITAPDATGMIHACFDSGGKGAGKIRIVSAGTTCKPSESPLSWRSGLESIGDFDGTECDPVGPSEVGTLEVSTDGSGELHFTCEGEDGACMFQGPEVCDAGNVDEDCNDLADNADPMATGQETFYPDNDGDGFGDPGAGGLSRCDGDAGFVADGGDCDDGDPAVNPGGDEACTNGKDDDCNGQIDSEDDACGGTCTPQTEVCDGADNSCEGDVDEGYNVGSWCSVGVGQCSRNGQTVCDATGGTMCNTSPGSPVNEDCENNLDDDCDGADDSADSDCPAPPAGCGDGVIAGDESCDDGDTNPDDGCSSQCQEEAGWVCTGSPSVCSQT